MYETDDVIQTDAGPAIKMKKIHERISIPELWEMIAQANAPAVAEIANVAHVPLADIAAIVSFSISKA